MFERFTESARRALFFARYEVSQQGGISIEPEHLLLGLAREPPRVVASLLALSGKTMPALREEIESHCLMRSKLPTSVEIPFGEDTKRVLVSTAEEADRLGQLHIGPEHILLALLRLEGSVAHKVLTSNGMTHDAVRHALVNLHRGSMAGQAPRVEVLNQIERIKGLVERLAVVASDPEAITELAHVIHVELSSLVAALQPPSESS